MHYASQIYVVHILLCLSHCTYCFTKQIADVWSLKTSQIHVDMQENLGEEQTQVGILGTHCCYIIE